MGSFSAPFLRARRSTVGFLWGCLFQGTLVKLAQRETQRNATNLGESPDPDFDVVCFFVCLFVCLCFGPGGGSPDPDFGAGRFFVCFVCAGSRGASLAGNSAFHSDVLYKDLAVAVPQLLRLLEDPEEKTRANAAGAPLGPIFGARIWVFWGWWAAWGLSGRCWGLWRLFAFWFLPNIPVWSSQLFHGFSRSTASLICFLHLSASLMASSPIRRRGHPCRSFPWGSNSYGRFLGGFARA